MGFAAALGLNTKQAYEILKEGQSTSWMFENRAGHMLVDDKIMYSALNIIVKDVVSISTILGFYLRLLIELPGHRNGRRTSC
jgi:3-hydroxyisobutyrate dehydrogenase-like beta-hydroxyacid dehydrogenase